MFKFILLNYCTFVQLMIAIFDVMRFLYQNKAKV